MVIQYLRDYHGVMVNMKWWWQFSTTLTSSLSHSLIHAYTHCIHVQYSFLLRHRACQPHTNGMLILSITQRLFNSISPSCTLFDCHVTVIVLKALCPWRWHIGAMTAQKGHCEEYKKWNWLSPENVCEDSETEVAHDGLAAVPPQTSEKWMAFNGGAYKNVFFFSYFWPRILILYLKLVLKRSHWVFFVDFLSLYALILYKVNKLNLRGQIHIAYSRMLASRTGWNLLPW